MLWTIAAKAAAPDNPPDVPRLFDLDEVPVGPVGQKVLVRCGPRPSPISSLDSDQQYSGAVRALPPPELVAMASVGRRLSLPDGVSGD